MHNTHAKIMIGAFLSVASFIVLTSCAGAPGIIGKWQEPGTTATIEFFRDGSFTAVDDMEMEVSGSYVLRKDGGIRFEIIHPESPPETISAVLSIKGDELTLTFGDDKEIEKYRRAE
jgi:hypothetical protein